MSRVGDDSREGVIVNQATHNFLRAVKSLSCRDRRDIGNPYSGCRKSIRITNNSFGISAVTISYIGRRKSELDSPALCIDLDAMERNIQRMAEFVRRGAKNWRPHAKCHKTPAIALAELAAGAIGVTCAKVSEAEVMAAAGVRDILIANMVVGDSKWERLAALCRSANPIVACDHYAQIEPLAAICVRNGVTCRVIVEVNIGLDRVGTRPGRDTVELAQIGRAHV